MFLLYQLEGVSVTVIQQFLPLPHQLLSLQLGVVGLGGDWVVQCLGVDHVTIGPLLVHVTLRPLFSQIYLEHTPHRVRLHLDGE